MTEALGVVSGVIACIQITQTVLKVCKNYNDPRRDASWELPGVQKEMEDLHRVLQLLKPVAKKAESANSGQLRGLALLCVPQGPLDICKNEIERLEKKLKTPDWMKNFGLKRMAIGQSLRWPLKEADTRKTLEKISRTKDTLQLALDADQTLLLLEIQELSLFIYNTTLDTKNVVRSIHDVISQTRRDLRDDARSTHDAFLHMQKDFQQTGKLVTEVHLDSQREKMHRWLSGPDPSTNYVRALRSRQDKTGLWFLRGAFNEWTEAAQLMWLHGKPGCGKTVLSSTIIAEVHKTCLLEDVAVAYFYFDFNDAEKQKSDNMIRSIVKQLYTSLSKKHLKLESLFSSCNNGERQPSSYDLMQVLKDLMEGFHKTYIILDALDECSDVEKLLVNIEEIQNWQLTGLHMLLTSRRHMDIEDALKPLTNSKSRICIQSAAVDADIETYIRHRLQTDKKLSRWKNHTLAQEEIINALKSKADGMFRWAVCQLDALQSCPNLTLLRKALESLPRTLDETYARILFNIRDGYSEYAIKILQWLAYSMRPLELGELAEVVAINPQGDPWFDHDARFQEPRDILTICQGLVVEEERDEDDKSVDDEDDKSADDENDESADDEDDDADKDEDDSGDHDAENDADWTVDDGEKWDENNEIRDEDHDEDQDEDRSEDRNVGWVDTSDDSEEYGNNGDDGDNIGDEENSKYANNDESSDQIDDDGSQITGCEDLSAVDGSSDSEIIPYAKNGFKNRNIVRLAHFSVKEYLLSGRIRKKSTSCYAEEASKYAIQEISAHESIVAHCLAYLLQFERDEKVYWSNGISYRRFIKDYHLSSYAATQWINHVKVLGKNLRSTKQLCSMLFFEHKKAFQNSKVLDEHCLPGTPLLIASEKGAIELVRLVLENGADVNTQTESNPSALLVASKNGHLETVRLLLENGADVNAQDESGDFHTALQAASYKGHVEIMQLLLTHGAEVNAQGGEYHTALHAAAMKGHEEVIKVLLSEKADVSISGQFSDIWHKGGRGTALHAASAWAQPVSIRLLLEYGADVNAKGIFDGREMTALELAEQGGIDELWGDTYLRCSDDEYEKVVSLLRSAQDSQRNVEVSQVSEDTV